jgi:lipoprotein-releasing system ATP-binding protein
MTALVRTRGLTKTFGAGAVATEVLKGMDLEIHEGEFVALVGPSGSGKSTLLAILGTLLRPTGGELWMRDCPLTGLSDGALTLFRNRYLGFVFQFHHLLPEFTAVENVLFPAAARLGWETAALRARARGLLDRVGLADRADFLATKLSGGQKQRVAIARALVNRPWLVLADEPTGNLDRETSWQVMELLREINREERATFFVSTHDPEIAAWCDRRISVVDGRIVGED